MKPQIGEKATMTVQEAVNHYCNLRRAAVADAFSGGRPALMNGC